MPGRRWEAPVLAATKGVPSRKQPQPKKRHGAAIPGDPGRLPRGDPEAFPPHRKADPRGARGAATLRIREGSGGEGSPPGS
jgi:hypothetical protein